MKPNSVLHFYCFIFLVNRILQTCVFISIWKICEKKNCISCSFWFPLSFSFFKNLLWNWRIKSRTLFLLFCLVEHIFSNQNWNLLCKIIKTTCENRTSSDHINPYFKVDEPKEWWNFFFIELTELHRLPDQSET